MLSRQSGKPKLHRVLFPLFALALSASAGAQVPQLAPNAPKDKPVEVTSVERFDRLIAPYVAQAKASYPQARERFLRGLPRGESFFVKTELVDSDGKREGAFVFVQSIRGGQVQGRIWTELLLVKEYKDKAPYSFPEERVLDWLISKLDGSEEGNYVGKFLDSYQQR